ncbi:hypothetical protein C8A03DRAFT_13907 [Achaetomium macrosporum]|uniref:Uncharacterized protein n=1 Tax=Achaetomium macrosporum TaxID=79813 RepID=A0AAN7CDV0_9PEZI|nr:hypothetical protein C8A03DRAFT_13907 [Achaetomium macrosporum]
MDSQSGDARESWTILFVQSAQRERQRREGHTTDVQQSISTYTSAAERKIKDALRDDLSVLSPGGSMTLPARPRTKAR